MENTTTDEMINLAFRLRNIDRELGSLRVTKLTDCQQIRAAAALCRERTTLRHQLVIASMPPR